MDYRDVPVAPMYSNAERCRPCGMRALLDKPGAGAMSRASFGDLTVFACPASPGWWHVWSPRIESGQATGPTNAPVAPLYSNAERCDTCGRRALLDEQGARNLVRASFGGLDMFECPNSAGWWHVWSPKIETPQHR